jgi:hypothetical protein
VVTFSLINNPHPQPLSQRERGESVSLSLWERGESVSLFLWERVRVRENLEHRWRLYRANKKKR